MAFAHFKITSWSGMGDIEVVVPGRPPQRVGQMKLWDGVWLKPVPRRPALRLIRGGKTDE